MSATPAQVANDLEAQAAYFGRRDEPTATACRDCAQVIRALVTGQQVDAQTFGGLHRRMLDQELRYRKQSQSQIGKSLDRGLRTLTDLWATQP